MGGVKIGAEVKLPIIQLIAYPILKYVVDEMKTNFLEGGHSTVQWTNPLGGRLWSEFRLAECHGGVV